MRALLLAVAIVPMAIAVFGEVIPAISQDDDPSEAVRGELQKKRLDSVLNVRLTMLQELVETVTEEYRLGRVRYDVLGRVIDKLIEAEIQLAESPEVRVELRQRHIELRQGIVTVVQMAYHGGRASETDGMFARVDFHDAVVELERETARGLGLIP